MPNEQLPDFRYFKDPLGVGVFEESDTVCLCCSLARGYIYTGRVFAREELQDAVCPWCIADGTASVRFGATFVDERGVGGCGEWDQIPEDVSDVIVSRTPSFVTWQPERWWTHCGDAAVFIDYAGRDELLMYGDELIQQLRAEAGMDEAQWEQVFRMMHKEGNAVAYVFQCGHCGKYGGFWDCN